MEELWLVGMQTTQTQVPRPRSEVGTVTEVKSTGKGKEKDAEGDVVMEIRFKEYGDLTGYEAEDNHQEERSAAPLVAKTLPIKRVKTFVVHGITCDKPISGAIQDICKGRSFPSWGVMGARWSLSPSRASMGKVLPLWFSL